VIVATIQATVKRSGAFLDDFPAAGEAPGSENVERGKKGIEHGGGVGRGSPGRVRSTMRDGFAGIRGIRGEGLMAPTNRGRDNLY